MKFGRVVGSVVSTHSYPSLQGMPLLLVQICDPKGAPLGDPVIAGDRIGVGPGEYVYMEEAMEAGLGLSNPLVPIDLGIVGRADLWSVDGETFRG